MGAPAETAAAGRWGAQMVAVGVQRAAVRSAVMAVGLPEAAALVAGILVAAEEKVEQGSAVAPVASTADLAAAALAAAMRVAQVPIGCRGARRTAG